MAYILVVDDDIADRRALIRLLKAEGHRTCWAADGHNALKQMRIERPDVVLLDLVMQGMSGWEVARLKMQDPQIARIPFIIVTALAAPEIATPTVNPLAGAMLVIGKPVDGDLLFKAIELIAPTNSKPGP
jgi:CheY-like chemotaxis protein